MFSLIAAAFLACSDDETESTTPPDGGGGPDARTDTSLPGVDASPKPDASDAGGDAAFQYKVTVLAKFDVTKRELPDGIGLIPGNGTDFGTPVVGLNNTGKVATVAPDGGYAIVSEFGTWNPVARLLYAHYDSQQGITGAVASFGAPNLASPPIGIYRMPTDGAAPIQITTTLDPNVGLPNTFGFHNGSYYIADSNGWITKMNPADGTTTKWLDHPSLVGGKDACVGFPLATPRNFGANALTIKGNDIFVTNFDLGALIKVPINGDVPGTPVALVQGLYNGGTDCSYQSMDGVAIDTDGSIFFGNSLKNTLYKAKGDGTGITKLLEGKPPFDQISNFYLETAGKKKRLLISNFANGAFVADAGPIPQLLSIDLPPDP